MNPGLMVLPPKLETHKIVFTTRSVFRQSHFGFQGSTCLEMCIVYSSHWMIHVFQLLVAMEAMLHFAIVRDPEPDG